MSSPQQDLQFVKEALPQLSDYLLSNELYWPLGAALPRLTPGSLLLALARLRVEAAEEDKLEAQSLGRQAQALRQKWLSAWQRKVAREIANRLRLWSQFLEDYFAASGQSMDTYRVEVRARVVLHLLLKELPGAVEKAALDELDHRLRARLVMGDFIWEPELKEIFRSDEYWFLYGRL